MPRLHSLALLLAASLTVAAWPGTLHVDGPGDGDSDGTDDFDTIAEAISGTAPSVWSDGEADTVAIMVDRLTEPDGFQLNGPSVWGLSPVAASDNGTLEGDGDGNGTWCDIRSEDGSFAVSLRNGQAATFRHCKIFPGTERDRDLITILAAAGARGASVTLEDLWLTAPDARNHAADPAVDAFYLGVDALDRDCAALRAVDLPASSEVAFTLRRVSAGFHRAPVVDVTVGDGSLLLEDCLFQQNGYNPAIWVSALPAIRMQTCGESHVRLDRVEFIDNDSGAVHLWALSPSGRLNVWVGPGCEVIDNFWRVFRVGADEGGQVQIDLAGTREEPITLHDNFRGLELTLTADSSLEARNVIATESRYEGLRLVMTGRPSQARFENCLFAVNGVAPFYRYDLDHPTNVHLENTSGAPASVEFTRCTIHAVGARGGGEGDDHQWPTLVRGTGSSLEALFTNCILSGSGAEEAFDLRDDAGGLGTSNTAWLRQCAMVFQGPQAMGHINAIGAGTMILEGLRIEAPGFPNANRPPDDLSFDVTNQDFAVWGPGGAPLTGWGDFRDSSLVGIRLR